LLVQKEMVASYKSYEIRATHVLQNCTNLGLFVLVS
jgi:hypothetical protein